MTMPLSLEVILDDMRRFDTFKKIIMKAVVARCYTSLIPRRPATEYAAA